ncbi:hypothetical protein FS749_000417 [Ceratobasidium sp. UAMH 11750]|nr:hypothetical protein FS749_000417 [Ceratobasidium sp. UAMH 11750]
MHARSALFVVAFHLIASLDVVRAFNFTFLTIPAQCEELSIAISGGTPPYRLLIVPIGTLLTPPEIRTIVDRNITGTSDSFTFNYPAASQFVAMMSDATGIGTGGTSAIIAVGGGTKSDCLPASASAPKFYLYLDPTTPTQCGTMNVSWSADAVPPVSVYTMVIGGQSGALSIPNGASSVDWTTNIRVNTTMMFVAGDSRGPGTGGSSELLTVGPGSNACINANSPSSTQRPPAGGINTAGGSTPTSAPSNGGSNNVGAIVGGVIGGVAGVIMFFLVLLFFYRRRKHHRNSGTRPMKPDLIDPSEDQPVPQEGRGELPQFYEPEPFIIPDALSNPETSSRHSLHSTHDGQQPRTSMTTASGIPGHGRAPSRLSVTTMSEAGGPGAPSSSGRSKAGMPPSSFRPVNFIQHEDAGDIPSTDQEPETVELPPAYTDFRNRTAGTSGDGAGAGPSGAATSTAAPAAAPAEST